MDFLDAYSVRARLFPAVLAIAPAFALFLLGATWSDPGMPELITALAVAVLFFAAADLARRMGKRKERQLFADTGGRPENRELSRSDQTLDDATKDRYRAFLAKKLGVRAPSAQSEQDEPQKAQAFCNQCYTWLRENTRDTEKFKVLFNENISYGFRRNLLGLKPFGIALNLMTLAGAAALFHYHPDFSSMTEGKLVALAILAAIHACYFTFAVTKRAVLDASAIYARQLVMSCETLMS
ncbi:hypothetical protein RFM23_24500 [Mesorhizobium abyssinicae]|uniref:DUF4231 domain-containing protein n=1 Tax=Mesorhizobium abyssinicae TaxID=1209958 RepID=A0ABU5ATY9_9HYPH|nr:hypothetical protein [Mesorhizobium abyssinicae]MDX8540780.1 hypothetical protein [Mesorhizobium abyssinicae]